MTTADLTNDEYAARMRERRGDKPQERRPSPLDQVAATIRRRLKSVNPDLVTVGNLEAAVKNIPGVEEAKLVTRDRDAGTLDFEISVTRPLKFIPVTIHLVDDA